MFAIAARRAAPRLASKQQKRGIVDYLTNYPDKVRIMMLEGKWGAYGMCRYEPLGNDWHYLLPACTVKRPCGQMRQGDMAMRYDSFLISAGAVAVFCSR